MRPKCCRFFRTRSSFSLRSALPRTDGYVTGLKRDQAARSKDSQMAHFQSVAQILLGTANPEHDLSPRPRGHRNLPEPSRLPELGHLHEISLFPCLFLPALLRPATELARFRWPALAVFAP